MPAPLISLSFAVSTGIESALTLLCQQTQTFLGFLVMILIILAPVTTCLGSLISIFTKGKHKLAELTGKVFIALGVLFLVGAVILIIIYLLTPFIIMHLLLVLILDIHLLLIKIIISILFIYGVYEVENKV